MQRYDLGSGLAIEADQLIGNERHASMSKKQSERVYRLK